jgi:hypothetical protein
MFQQMSSVSVREAKEKLLRICHHLNDSNALRMMRCTTANQRLRTNVMGVQDVRALLLARVFPSLVELRISLQV